MISKEILEKIKPGARVRVHERVVMDMNIVDAKSGKKAVKGAPKEAPKERISKFEGLVLARKHGNQPGATFTVRAVVAQVGMEKIFPINSPSIIKVDVLSSPKKVQRAKLYYLRDLSPKGIRQKLGVD